MKVSSQNKASNFPQMHRYETTQKLCNEPAAFGNYGYMEQRL